MLSDHLEMFMGLGTEPHNEKVSPLPRILLVSLPAPEPPSSVLLCCLTRWVQAPSSEPSVNSWLLMQAERQFCFPFYSFVKLLGGAVIDIP